MAVDTRFANKNLRRERGLFWTAEYLQRGWSNGIIAFSGFLNVLGICTDIQLCGTMRRWVNGGAVRIARCG